MKIFPFVLLLFLFSCSDPSLSETIIGTWKLETMSIDQCPDANNNVASIDADVDGCLTINAVTICQTVNFNNDNTGESTTVTDGMLETSDVNFTVNNNNNTVISCDLNGDCHIFSVENDVISLTSNFGDCKINTTYVKQ